MPSPIDSTVPVSATSISRSYSRISRFRMSVISPGLMSIARLSPRQVVAQLGELRAQAAVEYQSTDPRDRAADQARIDAHLQLDFSAGARGQRAAQPVVLGGA